MKRIDFIQIPGYALWGLHLTGNELLCYGLAYSFSQSELGYFKGTQDEIAEVLNISKRSANAAIRNLEEKELISRSVVWNEEKMSKVSIMSVKVQNLQLTKEESAKFASTKVQNLQHPPIIYTDNNTDINNISTMLQDLPLTPSEEQTPKNNKSAKAKPSPQVPLAPLPYHSAKFNEVWGFLCSMPKWKNKTNYALNISIRKLSQVTEAEAIGMIEEAIEKSWQGIFLPKDKQQSTKKTKYIDIKDVM